MNNSFNNNSYENKNYNYHHLFTNILNNGFKNKIYSQSYEDNVFETINIPNSNLAGINPENIIYANNKFYVWGLGAVIVIDAENLTIINTLVLSKSAQYDYHSIEPLILNPPHSKMAYNGVDRIYALSPDNEIYIIDTESDSFLNSVIEKPGNVPDYFFENSIIRYDFKNNRLLWSISWMGAQSIPHAHIEYYDLENDDPERIWYKDRDYTLIYDMAFNKLTNYFYLSCGNNKIEVCQSDVSIFYIDETINTTGPNSQFLYITPTEENDLHRIYCISYDNIYWINGADNSHGSFTAEAFNLRCLAYNPQNNKLYISGNSNVYIYNASEPQGSLSTISLDINGNDEITYYMEYFYDRIYACKSVEIVTIASDNAVTNLIQKENNYFYSAAYDPIQQNILFCNTIGGAVEIVNAPQTYNGNQIITGVSVFKSVFNPIDRKFYFYSDDMHDDSKLVVINYSDNSYHVEDIMNFENNISSCVYNPNLTSHHLLISSYSTTNQIIKLNAETNEIEGTLDTDNEFCENIFISPEPNSRIYCATGMNSLQTATIEVFNANDYEEYLTLPNLGENSEEINYRMKFCYDNRDNLVFFILYKRNYNPFNQWGFLGKIDINDEENPLTLVELDYSPEKIVYAECLDKIFIKNTGNRFITYFDCDNLNIPLFDEFPEGSIIMDIEYGDCFFNNTLYILGSNGICRAYINADGYPPLHQWEMSEFVTSMKWNPIDKKLYVFSPYNIDRNHEGWMYLIDPLTAQMLEEKLPNNTIWRYEDYLPNNEMKVDSYSGRLLCSNGSHSNVSVTPENIILNPKTWDWISFPRLAFQGTSPQPELEKINSFPSELHLLNYPLQDMPTNIKSYDFDNNEWSGNIQGLYSIYGYKLYTDNQFESYFPITGEVLDPETPLTIFDEHENWVGYFLPETQSPFDAVPEEVLPHLKSIRAQYWSCLNYAFIAPPPKSTTSSIGEWRCLCNQGRIEIEYNDMVIFTLGNTEEQTFAWNRAGGGGALINKDAPEYFQFSEQPDYEAIFMDLDSIDLPDEIGAFAGDSCIGATKVLPDDTAAMICAYTQGFEGEEIRFELMYSTKSTRPVVNDYLVFNNKTRINENRKIIIGEKQPFYLVSFNKSNTNTEMINPSWIHCLPNPAGDETIIAYFIPGESQVQIRLSNSLGKEVLQWNQGKQTPGNYQLKLNTSELPSGYYLVGLYSENQTCTEKLLIVR